MKKTASWLVIPLTVMLVFAGCDDESPSSSTDASQDGIADASTDMGGDSATIKPSPDASEDVLTDGSTTADMQTDTKIPDLIDPDVNADGTLNILVIGTNTSITNASDAFSPDQIAVELQNILSADASISIEVNVVSEDIYRTKNVKTGLGQGGTEYDFNYFSHSLAQYYYWPEGREKRISNLEGKDGVDWDYVVIGGDPHIVATLPGYYSLGVNKIAASVVEGDGRPLLLMQWQNNDSSTDHFEEFTYRTSVGAKVALPTIPAGLVWNSLPAEKKDTSPNVHPTPNGSYLAAASIFSHIYQKSAASSEYSYDDEIAEMALTTFTEAATKTHFTGKPTFLSPFKAGDIADDIVNYNHTGSSSERGILRGLRWVFNQSVRSLEANGTPPINFNYGRANTNFEPNKRYEIDSAKFDFSLGFPMQDHRNNGDISMLYGLDKRVSERENGTDLGVALHMIKTSELPQGRAIPIRTLFAQLKEAIPTQSAFSDAWHMHGDLDKASGAYMHTLLTGECALGEEPEDKSSGEWNSWMAHKIGYETAWNLMYLEAIPPNCD